MTKARDLANIISGGFDATDIPNLDTAKITSGTFADARLPATALNSNVDLTNLSASNLTSGTIPTARITALPSGVGGKLLQHQFDSDSSTISFSNTSFVDTNLSINFTPQSSSSSILIFGCVQLYHDGGESSHGSTEFKILNGSSTVGESITTLIGYGGNEAFWSGMLPYYLKESSSNTNQRTYKIQVKNSSSGASASYNQYGGLSTLNIMEIA